MTKHELLKIKIRASDRESKQAMIDKIVDITQANLVQVIGNVMVIYRAFDEDPCPTITTGFRLCPRARKNFF
jgi:RNA-binding protein